MRWLFRRALPLRLAALLAFPLAANAQTNVELSGLDPPTRGAFWLHSLANPTFPIASFKIAREPARYDEGARPGAFVVLARDLPLVPRLRVRVSRRVRDASARGSDPVTRL